MNRFFSVFFIVFTLFASCEDKKSSAENTEVSTPEPENESSEAKDTIAAVPSEEKEEEKEKERPPGPLLVQEELIPFLTKFGKENPHDKIRIKTRFGNIDVKLFEDTPLHRANFLFLVKNDYFNNTFFHRVDPGFVIQAGNSDNASTNKKRHYIGDYLIPNESKPWHPHVRGAFSAAKYSDMNTSNASSPYEFFIVQGDRASHLNKEFTVFGKVIDGMDVVDEIAKVKTGDAEWPIRNIYIDVEILE